MLNRSTAMSCGCSSGTQNTRVEIWSLQGALAAQICNGGGAQNNSDAGICFSLGFSLHSQ